MAARRRFSPAVIAATSRCRSTSVALAMARTSSTGSSGSLAPDSCASSRKSVVVINVGGSAAPRGRGRPSRALK
jgi:hypothetical protein